MPFQYILKDECLHIKQRIFTMFHLQLHSIQAHQYAEMHRNPLTCTDMQFLHHSKFTVWGAVTHAIFSTIVWTGTNHQVIGWTVLSGCIHTYGFLNYCVNLKVQEWVVYPFLCNFWCHFYLNNEGIEVQHKAVVNTRNRSHNSYTVTIIA